MAKIVGSHVLHLLTVLVYLPEFEQGKLARSVRSGADGRKVGIKAMIVYQLCCSNGHEFEAWFRDGATYDQQAKGGDVGCPHCGDTTVSKAVMAPNIAVRRSPVGDANMGTAEVRAREVAEKILNAVGKLRTHVEESCDDVGDQFASEARRIHYGEAEERGIHGRATEREAEELDEEGIEFYRLPDTGRRDS